MLVTPDPKGVLIGEFIPRLLNFVLPRTQNVQITQNSRPNENSLTHVSKLIPTKLIPTPGYQNSSARLAKLNLTKLIRRLREDSVTPLLADNLSLILVPERTPSTWHRYRREPFFLLPVSERTSYHEFPWETNFFATSKQGHFFIIHQKLLFDE